MNLTLFLSGFWHGHSKMLFSKQFVLSGVVDRNPTSRREMVQVSVTSSWGEGRRLYVPCDCQSCLHRPFFSTRMRELTARSTFSRLLSALALVPTGRNLLFISCGCESTSDFLNSAAASCSFLIFSFCLTEACVYSERQKVCC